MQFEFEQDIAFGVESVVDSVRERLAELAAFLPEVASIEPLDKSVDTDGITHMKSLWCANPSSVPVAVRHLVSQEMLQWRDIATWHDNPSRVCWRFETAHFKTLYTCSGTNYFEPVGDSATRIRMTGELCVFAEQIPGVPNFIAKRLRPRIEEWLVGMMMPNLEALPVAIEKLLSECQRTVYPSAFAKNTSVVFNGNVPSNVPSPLRVAD